MRPMRFARLFCLVSVVVNAAPPPPPKWTGEITYKVGRFPPKNWSKVSNAKLQADIKAYLYTWDITQLQREADDRSRQTFWSSDGGSLSALNRPEQIALLLDLSSALMGGEADILIDVDGGSVPVTVYWDEQKTVAVRSGPVFSFPKWTATPEAVSEKYGVGAFENLDAKWDARTVGLVDRTLALLTPEELALIKGLKFVRKRDGGIYRAHYVTSGKEGGRFFIYDSAFNNDEKGFVGDPAAPTPEFLYVLLHEIGHAIADARTLELTVANYAAQVEAADATTAVNAKISVYNGRIDAKAAADELGPLKEQVEALSATALRLRETRVRVSARRDRLEFENKTRGRLAEYELTRVLAPSQSPTDYGRKDLRESFAESYSLFKTDPAALARAAPQALAWFQSGEYLKLANQPLPVD